MTYAIVGYGAVGQALAKTFARKRIEVAVATRRSPDTLSKSQHDAGSFIIPKTLAEALEADVIVLAVPFSNVDDVAAARTSWTGKTVIDATNAYGKPLAEFNGLTASAFNARKFPGVHFVKGFNHLPATKLSENPEIKGGHRVIFFAGDDQTALQKAFSLATELGFAPVSLGSLAEGSPLTSARGTAWSPLNFQDLVKFD